MPTRQHETPHPAAIRGRSYTTPWGTISFNGRMRDELLNECLFFGLAHARIDIAAWVADYNTERPHSALGYQTPAAFAATLAPTTTTATGPSAAIDEVSAAGPVAHHPADSVSTQRTLIMPG